MNYDIFGYPFPRRRYRIDPIYIKNVNEIVTTFYTKNVFNSKEV